MQLCWGKTILGVVHKIQVPTHPDTEMSPPSRQIPLSHDAERYGSSSDTQKHLLGASPPIRHPGDRWSVLSNIYDARASLGGLRRLTGRLLSFVRKPRIKLSSASSCSSWNSASPGTALTRSQFASSSCQDSGFSNEISMLSREDAKSVKVWESAMISSGKDYRSSPRSAACGAMVEGFAFDKQTRNLLVAMQVCMRKSLVDESILHRQQPCNLMREDFEYTQKVRTLLHCSLYVGFPGSVKL
jgi:hypothetical protein